MALVLLLPAPLMVTDTFGAVAVAATAALGLLDAATSREAVRPRPRPWGGWTGVGLGVTLFRLDDPWFARSSAAVAGVAALMLGVAAYREAGYVARRRVRRVTAVALATLGAIALVGIFGALRANSSATKAESALRDAVQAARDGDRTALTAALERTRHHLADSLTYVDAAWQQPAQLIPVLGPNLRAAAHSVRAAEGVVAAALPGARLADLDALRLTDGAFDVAALAALADDLRPAADQVRAAGALAGAPRSPWLLPRVDHGLDRLAAALDEFGADITRASDLLDVLPAMLGDDGPRRYVVMFVTPSEARGGGGFPGQTAELLLDGGSFDIGDQYRSADLAAPTREGWHLDGAEEYLARYGTYRVAGRWQNITMSPDFPTIGHVAAQAYEQTTGHHIDGVIRVGPRSIAALLAVTGPVRVDGVDLTAETAVGFLARDQYTEFSTNEQRIRFLEHLVDAAIAQLRRNGIHDPAALRAAFGPTIASGDLTVWSAEPAEQAALAGVRLDGAVPPADGADTMFVTQHNLLPSKIDAWSTIDIDLSVATATRDDGAVDVRGTIDIALRNNAPADATTYQIGTGTTGLPRGTMRELITIYTPHTLTDIAVDGRPVDVLLQPELGRHAYQVTVEVRRGATAHITATFDGTSPGPYTLTVPAVPAVNPGTWRVTLDGRRTEFVLDRAATIVEPVGGR